MVETKPDLTPVTEADRAVEQALRERLASRRPGDAVLGEEYGARMPARAAAPLDHRSDRRDQELRARNPVWATLIALEEGEEVTVGVVSAPALHRRWWAARGAGAFLDDGLADGPRRLQVSAVGDLADAQLCVSAAWRTGTRSGRARGAARR